MTERALRSPGRWVLWMLSGMLLLGCGGFAWEASGPIAQLPREGQTLPIEARAILGGETIYLEVARSPQQQAIGLMFRSDLAPDRGMVFPFESQRIARFWMKNVSIPLDMLFVRDEEIVAIEANVPPCNEDSCPLYGPSDVPVDVVIELAGGRADELGVHVGDRVAIEPLER
ncbi:hypothetical protein KR51_00003620 [Rubidibacter lacunae KORDI 51-2]|uniref:DUF192 domain-containing protein n=1 Tax=Rubidibacter lacunae KORDI 51-2 TaxID=582515 RepID=U5DN03_9CHRO|nr:DUF192 domain-containing protein [Rubidibacter lacunae]ERN43046.1 hypothetical protein KR51_00003620 [Rubidibacter lacunae KORDI 51-2]